MNKMVTATGMKVQARAEGGIVIARTVSAASNGVFSLNERKSLTDNTTLVTPTDATKLLPTSTKDAVTWYHSDAVSSSASTSTGTYTVLSNDSKWKNSAPTVDASGYGYIDPDSSASNDELYYFVYDKISVTPDAQASSFEDLWISSCVVTSSSNALSSSLRVAVVSADKTVILAPVAGATTSYKVNNDNTATTCVVTSASGATPYTKTTANTAGLLLKEAAGITQYDVTIYVYFEGEDANHHTDNYTTALDATLDSLTIRIQFACTSVAAGS